MLRYLFVFVFVMSASAYSQDGGFVELFNGKDLDGWEQAGGNALYRVEDGAIVGQSVANTPNSFLCTKKLYGNFVLEYEFKCDNLLNSGVQIRSNVYSIETTIEGEGKRKTIPAGRVHGYQVEIDPNKPDRMWSGGVYDEGRRGWLYPGLAGGDADTFTKQGQAVYKPNAWNAVRVECNANRIRTWLNGQLRADFEDDMTPKGIIAVQVHGVGKHPEAIGKTVMWRNLRIKESIPRLVATGKSKARDGERVKRDLVYASVGERQLALDLYLPAHVDQAVPLIVWVHGGGWKGGGKGKGGRARNIVARGYALADVEYRLSGEAIFPAAIADCRAAIRWLRANADKYGYDGNRIGAWGSSAGGHLVALLGTAADANELDLHEENAHVSAEVQAVCDWFGPTDFLRMNDFPGRIDHDAVSSLESRFIGVPIQQNKEQVAKANPITYVSKDDPPLLIMHGENDQLVPYNQSEILYAALVKAGVDSTLIRVRNAGHGFRGADMSEQELFEIAAEFFDTRLKKSL